MDSLSRLTIIIPTFGRSIFVRRQIQFWSDLPVRVAIIDGSPEPISDLEQTLTGNISYVHMGSDFQSRMLKSVEYIRTEFVAVLGDDDFFSPAGLRACIDRLDADPPIIGCVGRSIRFAFQQNRILAEQREPQSTEFPASVLNGLDRLYATYHPGKIGALLYGVYRFEPWRDVINATYCVRYRTAYIYDTIIRVLLTYRSAIGLVDTLTWYCSSENSPVKTAPGWNRLIGGVDWLTATDSKGEVAECKRRIIDDLAALKVDDRQEIEPAVNFVFSELINRYAAKAAIKAKWSTRIKALVVRLSPRFVRQIGKKILPKKLKRSLDWTLVDFDQVVTDLASAGIKVDFADAQRFVRHVRWTHLKVS